MGLKVAPASLYWSQPSVPHSPFSSWSAISSPSSKQKRPLFCRLYVVDKSPLFLGAHQSSKLYWSRSCGNMNSRVRIIRRALTSSLDSFSDEEFSKKIQELSFRFQLRQDGDDHYGFANSDIVVSDSDAKFLENLKPFDDDDHHHRFDFRERDGIIPPANSVEIPLSLIVLDCSVKKAFSSMVFIIRELHSYTLQMREVLLYEDLQGILASVQKEMHASFVWLFQKVFSHTPTLMMYLMILLANYTVYSMSTNAAIAATPPVQGYGVVTNMEQVSFVEDHNPCNQKSDLSIVRTLRLSSSTNGKTTSVGGNNGGGGGGKYRPIGSGTDGDGRFDETDYNGVSSSISTNPLRTSGEESLVTRIEEEETLWNSIMEEASEMQASSRDEALDQGTIERFVSPVDAKIETDQHSEHLKTELLYEKELSQEPNNPLLLANYAQFLYIVAQDFDRAEEYFKRATKVESAPKDAEALNKYANFLWLARNDLLAAEETYLEAISAEPDNSYYAANYAHFLWNTGGEDTCFPLTSPDSSVDV